MNQMLSSNLWGPGSFYSELKSCMSTKPKTIQTLWSKSGTDVLARIRVRNVTQGWDHKFENQQHMDDG